MKLTSSIVAIVALSGMSFAGGMIMEPAYENEIVEVPVEPVIPEEVIVQPEVKEEVVVQPPVKVKEEVKAEVKPEVVAPAKASGLYIAGGLTDVAIANNNRASLFKDKRGQDRQIGLTGRVGYDFMDYLGAELRGTYGIAKDSGNKFKQIGGYLKPNYDVTDDINLYGLLGLSKTNPGVGSETGFSYGAGLDYGLTDKVSVFTDVVNYMKKSGTSSQWGLTLGAAYQF
jgi:opacity protein-like surface antigen